MSKEARLTRRVPIADFFASFGFWRFFVIRASSFESSLIKFDQIEIRPNIFASFASRFFQKMEKTRLFCGGVGMTGDHRLVPLFNRFRGMSRSVFLYPV